VLQSCAFEHFFIEIKIILKMACLLLKLLVLCCGHFVKSCRENLIKTPPPPSPPLLEWTMAVSHTGSFLIELFRDFVGLFWTSDQPVAKAFTYTGQHNNKQRGQTPMP
jgi:hypothetical protein